MNKINLMNDFVEMSGWNFFILFQYYKDDNDIIYDLIVKEIENTPVSSNIDFYVFKITDDTRISMYKTNKNGESIKLEQVGSEVVSNNFFIFPFTSATLLWEHFFNLCTTTQNRRTFISIHSHGAGFGFTPKFQSNSTEKIKSPTNFFFSLKNKKKELEFARDLKIVTTFFSNEIYSCSKINKQNENKLTQINEIKIIPVIIFKDAIKKTLLKESGSKIDFICLANCFMQCFETGYVFEDTAKFLIASEGTHISGGINYPKLYNDMGINSISNEMIAINICSSIDERFEHYKIKEFFKIKSGEGADIYDVRATFAVSVNDLGKYKEMKEKLSSLSESILKEIEKDISLLDKLIDIRLYSKKFEGGILNKCYDVFFENPIGIIDLGNYLSEMILTVPKIPLSPEIKSSIFELSDLIKQKMVVASHFPLGAYYRESPIGICPSGISIFFPRTKRESVKNKLSNLLFEEFYEKETNISEFLKDNKWREFIIKFYTSSDMPFQKSFIKSIRRAFSFFSRQSKAQ